MNPPHANPLVSVVIPTHNRPHTLLRALQSVLQQDFRDLEVIVVDDASRDDRPRQIVEALAAHDPRVRYLRRDRAGGASAARNAGIHAARGTFIAFQDDDDEWLAGKLSQQVAMMHSVGERCAWVGTALIRYRVDRSLQRQAGSECRVYAWPALDDGIHLDKTRFINDFFAFIQTTLVRRQCLLALGGFDEQIPISEDWELMLRLVQRWDAAVLAQPFVISYETATGLISRVDWRPDAFGKIWARHGDYLAQYPYVSAMLHYEVGKIHSMQNQRRSALRAYVRALRFRPTDFRIYAGMLLTFMGGNAIRKAAYGYRRLRIAIGWIP